MADLPFLKKKNKNRDATVVIDHDPDGVTNLDHHVTDELIEAIHKKDFKSIKEALKALVLIMQDEDKDQDQ